jgi:hypothetical protein
LNDEKKLGEKELYNEFLRIAKQTRENFIEGLKGCKHPGELGKARENVLKEFLIQFLPEPFDIGSGFVIDGDGNKSEQIDLIIFDKTLSCGIGLVGGVWYYPCESVVAVGEVKTSITSRIKFNEALGKIESVLKLSRSPITKKRGFGLLPKELRIIGFVFTSKSLRKETMYNELANFCSTRPQSHWPNFIIDFEKYLISYYGKRPFVGATPFADLADEWYVTADSQRDKIIPLFTCYLISQLVATKTKNAPNLLDYFGVKEIALNFLGPIPKYTGF